MGLAGLGIAVMAASAAAEDAFVDPLPPPVGFAFEESEDITNDDPDTAIARFGLDAAPWMPRVIAQMNEARGAGYRPDQIMLIEGAERQLYLVINWRRDLPSWIEFHKVTELENGQVWLTHVRTMDHYDHYAIQSLSGTGLFPGEAPVVVLYHEAGSRRCGMGYDLIELRRNTVDITPAPVIDGFADLDGDGRAEVIAESLGYDCGIGYGAISRILRRVEGRFVDACADFPALYAFWRDLEREVGFRGLYLDEILAPVYQQTREALNLAQAGYVEAAIIRARQVLDALQFHDRVYIEVNARWLLEFGPRDNPIPLQDLLLHARTVPPGGCPASAALQDLRVGMISPGAIERTERVTDF